MNARSTDPALADAPDSDPTETREWLDALRSALQCGGPQRALYLLQQLDAQAQELGLFPHAQPFSAYRNSIPLEQQGSYPGDLDLEERLTAWMRWNALVMVMRANQAYGELGGHIASYASAAEIFELGFNHFFQGEGPGRQADLVFFQPHSAPGVYARAFLEGRLGEEQLARYRQEVDGGGLCSYPHPWLMPDFWQFPTGSMGLGPLSAVYQARFMRYLQHRGLLDTAGRRVWGVFGDGEMDEPESIAGLTLAARETLDNLTFIVNCNLQRLDGPVRGNGQVIQELEALFTGAGWNVIKVLWGSDWDALFARDTEHVLLRALAGTVDGQYQTLGAKDGAYNIEHFFRQNPELQKLVAHMSEAEIDALKRGGHDFRKLHAAFAKALSERGRPTVILAKTKKGYGMGGAGESRMTAPGQEARPGCAAGLPQPLQAADQRRRRGRAALRQAGRGQRRDALPARTRVRSSAGPCRRARAGAPPCRCPPLQSWGGFRAAGPRQGDVDHHGGGAHARRLAEGRPARAPRRADRRRRGAHLRHGEPVPPDRHLRPRRPALRARGCRLDAELPRGGRRPTARGGHHRGRCAVVLGRRGHQRTACTACRCCRSTSTTRCSASSASAT
jgi:pyruvate dehydrogenase E1 component